MNYKNKKKDKIRRGKNAGLREDEEGGIRRSIKLNWKNIDEEEEGQNWKKEGAWIRRLRLNWKKTINYKKMKD